VSGLNQQGEAEPDPIVVPPEEIDREPITQAHKALPVWCG
jgi:hypothetical protein